MIDLEVIYDFLVNQSPVAAQRITESLLARAKQLESFPESGAGQQLVNDRDKRYRYLVEGNYKIIYNYLPEVERVYIEIVFDTRYNPDKLKV